jgi:hypothetical protein
MMFLEIMTLSPFFAPDGGGSGSSAGAGTAGGADGGTPAAAGAAAEGSTSPAEGQQQAQPPSFDDILKDPAHRKEYDSRVRRAVLDRVKGSKDQLDRAHGVLAYVAARYEGLEPTDYDGIRKALEGDGDLLSTEAERRGMTVEQLRQIRGMEMELAQARMQQAQIVQQQRVDASMVEAAALQAEFPDFNPVAEMQDPEFLAFVRAGASQRRAYIAMHLDEMVPALMGKTAKEVQSAVLQNIAAGTRPIEGSTASATPATAPRDYSSWKAEDFDAVRAALERGTPQEQAVDEVFARKRGKSTS